MVQLYTDAKYLPNKDSTVVTLNDAEFNAHIGAKELDEEDRRLMKEIEGLEIINEYDGLCNGRYGCVALEHISTGLKTLLNIRSYIKQGRTDIVVDVTEAGPNVLEYIFDTVENTDFKIILKHCNVLKMKNRDIRLNGNNVYHTMMDMFVELSDVQMGNR